MSPHRRCIVLCISSTCPRTSQQACTCIFHSRYHERPNGRMTVEEFDYVIVGAGAAGCVLANRLSESGKNTVAVIEAGGQDSNIWIKIPAGFNKTVYNDSLNW